MQHLETVVRPRLPLSMRLSLGVLRHGPRDATVRFKGDECWRATRTPLGPATVCYSPRAGEVMVRAWGPGAEHAVATSPQALGSRDDLEEWNPSVHPLVAELDRRHPGLRMIATGAVLELAVPTVLEQKVQAVEAHESWRQMVWAWGEEAPGPGGLRLQPSPGELAGQPYYAYHRFNLERKRADIVRRLAGRWPRVEEAVTVGRSRLEAFAGVGAWTSAKVAAGAWADADAVAVGDFHLPSIVVHAFTGKRRGTDEEMLELLEPFRPHRGRAARLLKIGTGRPSRRAPKIALRDLRAS